MSDTSNDYIVRSYVNSFHYLYQDAELFHRMASQQDFDGRIERVQLCRTALILYVFGLEGLINRAIDHFVAEPLHDFLLEREQKFDLRDKWLLLPMLASSRQGASFDRSRYPWSHFVELVRLRNDFVHPKHDRAVYYRVRVRPPAGFETLPWDDIPKELSVSESDVIYRQTRIPKDPSAIMVEHVDTVKRVVDDMVTELDELLEGKITRENWLHTDHMRLVYPPGAQFDDLRR